MLLMADHDLKSLFVVAHHGYAGGVGAEIAVGDGVIGVAAQRRRQVLVSHVTRAQALYRAAARSRTEERHEIPLPGLAGPQSVVATPILLRGRLMGVLYVDSAEPGRFGTVDGQPSSPAFRLARTLSSPTRSSYYECRRVPGNAVLSVLLLC